MGWLRGAALTGAALCFLAGCSLVDAIGGSRERVVGWAAAHGFRAERITTGQFVLLGLLRQRTADDTLTIYIEGDGAPWPSPYHPPSDPTPRDPLALRLADRDTAPQLAYLGRPCQYQDD
ncbi:MAG: alpha/beta hydrolase, partial [Rhodocyclaceae bacterium]|nr:alpha/beta hydrolase [Rhodocyclaceae bacterium]